MTQPPPKEHRSLDYDRQQPGPAGPPERRTFAYYMQRLGPAGWLGLMTGTVPPLGSLLLFYYIQTVSQWLRSLAGAGPAIFSVAFVFLGGLNLLPTYVYSALGGWSFGFQTGLVAAAIGIVLAAMLGYFIGRAVAGERVVTLLEENPRWRAVYDALLRSGFGKTLWIVTLLRLPPNSPFAITNLVLSAAKTSLPAYALGTILGMLPRTALVVWLGAHVGGDEFKISEAKWVFWVSIAAAVVVIAIIGRIARQAVQRVVEPGIESAGRADRTAAKEPGDS